MKKATLIIGAIAFSLFSTAQNREANKSIDSKIKPSAAKPNPTVMAAGDTLMYMPLPGYYINPTDAPNFDIVTEDIDGLTPNPAGYTNMDFGVFYSTDSSVNGSNPTQFNYYHPWETPAPAGTDTAFFWSAISWFNPAGQADNWLMMGPITIPANGATLKWFERSNRYRDGYEVMATKTLSPTLTFSDFTDANFYSRTDAAFPSPTYATDTTWVLKSVDLPATYNGSVIAIAFHHNANDMDQLKLDEMLLVEKAASSINEFVNGVKLDQNQPNPFNTVSIIKYELVNNANVTLNVFDVTGKLVATQNEGDKTAGQNAISFNAEKLAAGAYYYSLKVADKTTNVKKMIIVK